MIYCLSFHRLSIQCYEPITCNGKSGKCPILQPHELVPIKTKKYKCEITELTNKVVRKLGFCKVGKCVSTCEYYNQGPPCLCKHKQLKNSAGDGRCSRCCINLKTGKCTKLIVENEPQLLVQGDECLLEQIKGLPNVYGVCSKVEGQQGLQCKPEAGGLTVTAYWSNISSIIKRDGFTKFLKQNMVMFVIIISLLIWVPCSMLIHAADKRHLEENNTRHLAMEGLMTFAMMHPVTMLQNPGERQHLVSDKSSRPPSIRKKPGSRRFSNDAQKITGAKSVVEARRMSLVMDSLDARDLVTKIALDKRETGASNPALSQIMSDDQTSNQSI